MPAKLKIETLHGAPDKDKLNEEWLELLNEGDAPFNTEGCAISVAKTSGARPRQVTTIKAGLVIQPGERVRLVTGSSGKKSHGDPPGDDVRNFHLFLKVPYLDRPGLTVRLANRQLEVCRGIFGAN